MDWVSILPQLIFAGGGFLIFCVGAFWRRRPADLLFWIALVAAIAAGAAAVFALPASSADFLKMLEVGGVGRFLNFLLALITGISVLFSYQYGKVRDFSRDEYYGLLLFAALGMTLVAGALHWLTFFLGLEVLSISLYVLIAIRREDRLSAEAGIKYFIMGAVASSFLTFGIALVYAMTGRLNIAQSLAAGVPAANFSVVLMGFALILAGVGFKISMVPFHLWTPDVYQGAPAPVTAFLSTGSKVALFAALLRFAAYSGDETWRYLVPVLWGLAALTMIVGNISAVAQTRVKRLLAYSSIAQMGYLLMALLAVKQNGPPAILFYLAAYALMDLGAFGTLASLSAEEGDLDALEDFRGLAFIRPWRSALLAVSLISLAGLPPTAGFIGKFALFRATLGAQYTILAVIGILTVIVSIYFYFKIIVALFMHPREGASAVPAASLADRFAGGLIMILIVALGLIPAPLFGIISRALPFLSTAP